MMLQSNNELFNNIASLLMCIVAIIIVLLIKSKMKNMEETELKENENLIDNTKPIKVRLYDIIKYTHLKSEKLEDSHFRIVRLNPIFQDINTNKLYICNDINELGDIKIKYDNPTSEQFILKTVTKKGRTLHENDTGYIYIKRRLENITFNNDQLNIENKIYSYNGKLKNDNPFDAPNNTLFNVMKDDFLSKIKNEIRNNNIEIVDAIIDFDEDDKINNQLKKQETNFK